MCCVHTQFHQVLQEQLEGCDVCPLPVLLFDREMPHVRQSVHPSRKVLRMRIFSVFLYTRNELVSLLLCERGPS